MTKEKRRRHYAVLMCHRYGCGQILQDYRNREIKFPVDFCGDAYCPRCGGKMSVETNVEVYEVEVED